MTSLHFITNILEKNKIALVTYSLSAGGLERVVANSSFLFEEMGYEVHIFVINSTIDYPYCGTMHCFKMDTLSYLGKVNAYLKLCRSIKNLGFNLIVDHRYRLNIVTEFLWQKVIYHKQRVVHYIHSAKLYNYIFKFKFWNHLLFNRQLIICVSSGIEDKLRALIPSLNTKTIYNYVQIKEPSAVVDIDQKFIVAVGRLDHSNVKQIDVLLACYAASKLPQQNVFLLILGDGIRLKQMRQLALNLGIADKIVFKGFVQDPSPYLKQALFTTLTSKYEGMPTVLIESLILGTPVVSFNCSTGPNEIIQHGVNGLLVPDQNNDQFVEAMNQMLTDKKLHDYVKRKGRSTVAKFDKASVKIQWLQLLNDTR